MTADRLKRVMWLLRELYPNQDIFTLAAVRRAIMQEIGTDYRTIKRNIKAIIEIGYLKRLNMHQFRDEGTQY